MSTVKKPILGITMGDPFGNGPEITVRSLADETVYDRCRPLVVGDAASMEYARIGFPQKSLIFFFGIRLLPPLAVIIANLLIFLTSSFS